MVMDLLGYATLQTTQMCIHDTKAQCRAAVDRLDKEGLPCGRGTPDIG